MGGARPHARREDGLQAYTRICSQNVTTTEKMLHKVPPFYWWQNKSGYTCRLATRPLFSREDGCRPSTRIPAGYKKMVRAKTQGHIEKQMLLFTPTPRDDGIQRADSAMDVSDGNCVVFVVQNSSSVPVKMKKGSILGEVVSATEYSLGGDDVDATSKVTVCNMATAADSSKDHESRLFKQLQLKIDHLT